MSVKTLQVDFHEILHVLSFTRKMGKNFTRENKSLMHVQPEPKKRIGYNARLLKKGFAIEISRFCILQENFTQEGPKRLPML